MQYGVQRILTLQLIVVAKRLGVSNDKIISIIVGHFKKLDRYYIDRLLPLIAQNLRTGVLEQVYVEDHRNGGCYIYVNEILDNGICKPSIATAYAIPDGDKEIKQRITKMLSLLGY